MVYLGKPLCRWGARAVVKSKHVTALFSIRVLRWRNWVQESFLSCIPIAIPGTGIQAAASDPDAHAPSASVPTLRAAVEK